MSVYVGYVGAKNCTTGPQPGSKALMAAFLGLYAAKGGTNLGIFNCRPVRGSTSTTSLHGEGRACDFGINPHGAAWGTALAEVLRAFSAELGIQCVIWDRRIWSGAKPEAGWRAYSGTNPHRDHIHVELTWAAARSLTAETAHRFLGGSNKPGGPVADRVLEVTTPLMRGADVLAVQVAVGVPVAERDQLYGPDTAARVRAFQQSRGLTVDGQVGPDTWRAIRAAPGPSPSPAPPGGTSMAVRDEVWQTPVPDYYTADGKDAMWASECLAWGTTHAAHARDAARQALAKVTTLESKVDALLARVAPTPTGPAALSEADVQRIAKAVIAVLGNTPPSGLAQVYEFTGTATPKDPA